MGRNGERHERSRAPAPLPRDWRNGAYPVETASLLAEKVGESTRLLNDNAPADSHLDRMAIAGCRLRVLPPIGAHWQAGVFKAKDDDSGGQVAIATLAQPIERGDGIYVLEFGETYFEVHAAPGGRVIQFARAGVPMLVASSQVSGDASNNYGSTFWTSPQSAWNWPPPAAIDTAEYEAKVDAVTATVTLKSPVIAIGNARLQLTKRFRADLVNDAIVIEFVLRNVGTMKARAAHWQITRVPKGGLTFFPTGTGVVQSGLSVIQGGDGVSWFDWDTSAPENDGKYIADGAEGWIAHVGSGLIFVKQFTDLALDQAAQGEGDVEIYATGPNRYVEIEPQGASEAIEPGASTTWTVVWKLRSLPAGVRQAVSAPGLVELARELAR